MKVHATVQVSLEIDIPDDVGHQDEEMVEDLLSNMDYNFVLDTETGAKIVDTTIEHWEYML